MGKLYAMALLLLCLTISAPASAGFWSDLYNALIAYSVPFDRPTPNPQIVNH